MQSVLIGRTLDKHDIVSLPADFVTISCNILAKKRSGKSYGAGVVMEELAKAKIPFICIDPMSAHYGLREKYDVYIFGGPKGDFPISRELAVSIADLIIESNISAIVDISGLPRRQMRLFVHEFLDRVYVKNNIPRHVFIEEADIFIPQRLMSEETNLSFEAVDNVVRRGGGKGLGTTLISQRPAVVNKDVLSQADLSILLNLQGAQDLKAVKDMMAYDEDVEGDVENILKRVKKFDKGEAVIYSPQWLKQTIFFKFRARETYHAGATPTFAETKQVKFIALDVGKINNQFQSIMAQHQTEEEQKGTDKKKPKKLQALEERMKQLEKTNIELTDDLTKARSELATMRHAKYSVDKKKMGEIEEEAEKRGARNAEIKYNKHLRDLDIQYQSQIRTLQQESQLLRSSVKQINESSAKALNIKPVEIKAVQLKLDTVQQQPPLQSAKHHTTSESTGEEMGLGKGPLRMLKAAAMFYPKPGSITKFQMATLSGYSIRSSSFSNGLSLLKNSGYIERDGENIIITTEGYNMAGEVESLPTDPDKLLEMWCKKLSIGAEKMLRLLFNTYPNGLTKEELSEQSGYSIRSSSFSNNLSKLRTNGLIEDDKKVIKISDTFFPHKGLIAQ